MSFERRVVDQVVGRYQRTNGGCVDLDAIARGEGIEVRDLHCLNDGASGQFSLEGPHNRPIIYINRNRSLAHQRFTMAHELGHYFMGHGPRPRDTLEQLRRRDPIEFSANRFAAELLMPEGEVRSLVRKMVPITYMAEHFGVSEEAMGYRLKNLGYS